MTRTLSLVAASLLAFLSTPFPFAHAKSFTFPTVAVDVRVYPDGSFDVTEDRTFLFDGSFHRAFIEIPRGDYRIANAVVSERGVAYRRVSGGEVSGTYTFTSGGDAGTTIRWYYDAVNERRTFRVTYRVLGAIVAYDDVAELYWKFIGDGWDAGANEVVATVHLPPGAAAGDVRAWGHGPLNGRVDIVDPTTIRWIVTGLPPRTFVEGRVAFPPRLVPGAPKHGGTRLPDVLSEEGALADKANEDRGYVPGAGFVPGSVPRPGDDVDALRLLPLWGFLLCIASLGVFVALFVRYGREHDVPAAIAHVPGAVVGKYVREPPADYPPAVVGYLMRWGQVKPDDFAATILDLARRGHLKMEEQVEESGILFRRTERRYQLTLQPDPRDDGLQPYERETLAFLAERALAGSVRDDEMKWWAERNPQAMHDWWNRFIGGVIAHGKELKLLERRGFVVFANVAASLAAIAFTLFALARASGTGSRWIGAAIGGLVIASAQALLTPVLRQRTLTGAGQYRAWKAFRRFLTEYSHMDEKRPTAVTLWEKYLVYAVPLGAADAVAKALAVRAPELQREGFTWYHSADGTGLGSFGTSFAAFTGAFAATAHAGESSPSSGEGFGGGFSGGGGDGGGGGGGGGGGAD